MNYWNSYHIFYDTHMEEVYDDVVTKINKHLKLRKYGIEFNELRTIVNCSKGFDFQQRSRFSRKEKVLFFDIVLDYRHYMELETDLRKTYIAESFLRDMEVLHKYKPKGFVLDDLKQDFKHFFHSIGWLTSDE